METRLAMPAFVLIMFNILTQINFETQPIQNIQPTKATMSNTSEIFLMHLMSSTSDVSIVQDNASSSSLFHMSMSFSESESHSQIHSRRRGSSRWEPTVALEDDLPEAPARQDSSKALGSHESTAAKDMKPRKPLRQSSSKDLSLPRIPRRQNSFRGTMKNRVNAGVSNERRRTLKGSESFSMCGAAIAA